ncbi:acyltransferase [Thiohalocapsa marina]|uniref:Acyltransferase n=1 Tax=Thiohalocapsa marina TaxID=424902 RepID=A0A5M8FEQ3_9GAMM|nr:acyltransferase [Thiohalocapsa marina]KAA6183157.1 acyltransferase [Thiohalocapsa marina]
MTTRTGEGGRDAWVDYAKAIGIVLVVYGHVARGVFNAGIPLDEPLYRLVDSIVYSFHMPLFFFLSGIFFFHSLRRRGRVALALNKVDTIVYPYILWSLIQGLAEVWLSRYTTGSVTLTEVLSLWDPRAQFWFLYALFLVFVTAILVYRRESGALLFGVLVVSALAYVFQARIPSLMHSDYVVKNLVFFALGVWFSSVRHRLAPWAGPWAALGLVLFIAVQTGFHLGLGLTHEDKGVASLLVAVVSILAVASLCIWLARAPVRWVVALGGASMAIYVMHILAGSGARVLLSRFLGVQDALTQIVLGCLAGILLPMLALWLMRRLGISGLLSAPRWLSAEALYRSVTRER